MPIKKRPKKNTSKLLGPKVDITKHTTVSGTLYVKLWHDDVCVCKCYAYHSGGPLPILGWTVDPMSLSPNDRNAVERYARSWYDLDFNRVSKKPVGSAGNITTAPKGKLDPLDDDVKNGRHYF